MTTPDSPANGPTRNGIHVQCPKCKSPLWFDTAIAGRRAKCRTCGTVMRIPTAEAAQTQYDNDQDPEFSMNQTRVKPAGRGFFGGLIQLMMMMFAGAGLSLSAYQQFSRADISPSENEEAKRTRQWMKDAFGDSEDKIKAFRRRIDDLWTLSGEVSGQFKQTETQLQSMMEDLKKEIESVSKRAETLEVGMKTVTEVYIATPKEDRPKIDFTAVDGVLRLADRTAGSVKLSETSIRRSGNDVVISCLVVSPRKNIKIVFYNGSVTAADGTTIKIELVNIGKTSWVYTKHGKATTLRPGIPVAVQWKMAVPEHHRSFSLIELVVKVEDVNERISYRTVAVPPSQGTVE